MSSRTTTAPADATQPVETPTTDDDSDFTLPQLSTLIITVTVTVFFGIVFLWNNLLVAGFVAGVTGCVLNIAISLLNTDIPIKRASGSILLFPASAGALGSFVLLPTPQSVGELLHYLIVLSGIFAAFGLVGLWTRQIGYWRVTRAVKRASYSLLIPVLVTCIVIVPYVLALTPALRELFVLVRTGLLGFVIPTATTPQFGSLLLVCGVFMLMIRYGLTTLPIMAFTPDQYVSRTDRLVTTLKPYSLWGYRLLLFVGIVVSVVELTQNDTGLYSTFPETLTGIFTIVTTSSVLRWGLVNLSVGIGILVGMVWIIERVAAIERLKLVNSLAQMTGGVFATVVVFGAGASVEQSILRALALEDTAASFLYTSLGNTALTLLVLVLLLVLLLSVLLSIPFTAGLGIIPDRGAAQSMIALSVATTGVVLQLEGGNTVVFFIAIVGALLVWDVGEYSTVLAEEIGLSASIKHVQMIHTLTSALLGVVTVSFGIVLLHLATGSTLDNTVVLPTVLAGVVGAVLLLAVLSSRK